MMTKTIKHQDATREVTAAKLLTGYLKVSNSVKSEYVEYNQIFDSDFVAYVIGWQGNRGLTPDGVIGPDTWTAIAKNAAICSTSKNRTSGYTLALQILLGGNLDCDGVFGPRTKAAVVAFQTANRLSADGICGPKTWSALITGSESAPSGGGIFVQPVDYKQGDSRWGGKMYSNHNDRKQTMANSGCGPTACADIVATMKDKNVTPWTLAQLSMDWGDRTYNSGTAWTFFAHVGDKYGFVKYIKSGSYSALTACLDAGGYVVCSMGPGYWTSGGHFICAWKYDETYTYCNDPASSTRKKQKTSQFKKECKQYFCFYPDTETLVEDNAGSGKESSKAPAQVKRGSKICDISKWQPNVDYDELVKDTALIILRAGYRKGSGEIRIDECFNKHADALKARGVSFGVYFYSIASTIGKAREEAQAFVKFAKDYNPLFWALDAEHTRLISAAIGAFADEMRALGIERLGCYVANEKYSRPYNYPAYKDKYDFTWIPRYSSTPPSYQCDIWQYTSKGRVGGIDDNVDLNKITGNGKPLEWFIGG